MWSQVVLCGLKVVLCVKSGVMWLKWLKVINSGFMWFYVVKSG